MKNISLSGLLWLAVAVQPLFPQAGLLDATFSLDGKVVTPFQAFGDDKIFALALQSNQKIVAAGYAQGSVNTDFGLARYEEDGSLDLSFGTDGKRSLDFGSGDDVGKSVVLQPDGKIIVAGSAFTGAHYGYALARFLENGDPDPSFGLNGQQTTTIGLADSEGMAVALQTDGKIVVAGTTYPSPTHGQMVVSRYDEQGLPDPSFGQGGMVATDMGSLDVRAQAMVIRPDGKIVVAGHALFGEHYDFALVQFHPDGTIDSLFGTNGRQLTDFTGFDDFGQAIALQPDGKIVVGGSTKAGTSQLFFALARYLSNGMPDNSFSQDGKTQTSLNFVNDGIQGLVLQSDGKIVVAGHSYNAPYNAYTFGLARYLTDGSLDTDFGGSGKVTTFLPGAVGNDQAYALALQNDGKIVAGGGSTSLDFALVRYLPGEVVGLSDAPFLHHSLRLYPNPATQTVTVAYSLQQPQPVSILLYDPQGKLIARLSEGLLQSAGTHTQRLRLPDHLPAGIYSLTLRTPTGSCSLPVIRGGG